MDYNLRATNIVYTSQLLDGQLNTQLYLSHSISSKYPLIWVDEVSFFVHYPLNGYDQPLFGYPFQNQKGFYKIRGLIVGSWSPTLHQIYSEDFLKFCMKVRHHSVKRKILEQQYYFSSHGGHLLF